MLQLTVKSVTIFAKQKYAPFRLPLSKVVIYRSSIDTKKRVVREFVSWWAVIEVYDHDFPSLAEGVAILHGIYDKAYVNIGVSHDASGFSCNSIKRWWNFRGRYDYHGASSILILVDCGGSNGYRHYVFKRAMQRLVDTIGIEICIAHYPSYASKWNLIEHRLFPHITRKLKGIILKSAEMVKELIETTTTKTGKKMTA